MCANVALGVEYDGGDFHGFQRQRNARSVQQVLEEAISQVADEAVTVAAAGRTDAGVHATQQVVSFATSAERAAEAWLRGVSSLTPRSLGVVWARLLDAPFHARFDAVSRRYMYVLSDAPVAPVLHRNLVAWSKQRLNAALMHRAAQRLIGEHDFTSFRAAACQSSTPMRNILRAAVSRRGRYLVIDVSANAFLLHMVRNIVGALCAVGRGLWTDDEFGELLEALDRRLAPPTAPPQGLYLVGVGYPGWELRARRPPLLG